MNVNIRLSEPLRFDIQKCKNLPVMAAACVCGLVCLPIEPLIKPRVIVSERVEKGVFRVDISEILLLNRQYRVLNQGWVLPKNSLQERVDS